jgi:hypothetical protein
MRGNPTTRGRTEDPPAGFRSPIEEIQCPLGHLRALVVKESILLHQLSLLLRMDYTDANEPTKGTPMLKKLIRKTHRKIVLAYLPDDTEGELADAIYNLKYKK